MTHLGSRVSALLDGRLPAVEEERAWAHVHECHSCRDLVEREGWVKTRLAGLSLADRAEREAPDRLKSSLLGCGSVLTPRCFPTSTSTHRARHRSLVAIGGGAAGAAVFGVLALGAAGSPQVERRVPVTDIAQPTQSVRPAMDTSSLDQPTRPASRRHQHTTPTDLTPQVVVVSDAPRVTMAP